jgi:NUP50 (Nucleoporin 50 kDa)
MAKRQSESGQISKEEYEAQQSSSRRDTTIQGGFEKAPEDVLKKRRFVRASTYVQQINTVTDWCLLWLLANSLRGVAHSAIPIHLNLM